MNLSDATIAQIMIPVGDLGRGTAFYRDILGIPLLFATPLQMAFFQCGAVRLLVGVMPADQRTQRGAAVYFQVADIQGVFSTLKASGVAFSALPHVMHRTPTTELWLAEFSDPDGNHLALMSDIRATGA